MDSRADPGNRAVEDSHHTDLVVGTHVGQEGVRQSLDAGLWQDGPIGFGQWLGSGSSISGCSGPIAVASLVEDCGQKLAKLRNFVGAGRHHIDVVAGTVVAGRTAVGADRNAVVGVGETAAGSKNHWRLDSSRRLWESAIPSECSMVYNIRDESCLCSSFALSLSLSPIRSLKSSASPFRLFMNDIVADMIRSLSASIERKRLEAEEQMLVIES